MKKPSDLVTLTTQDVSKAIPVTNTRIIAEKLSLDHSSVTRLIRKYTEDFEEFGRVGFEIQTIETNGGKQESRAYILNEQQATLLISYMKNTEKVRQFKKTLVKAFFIMKNELQSRANTRYIGVMQRKSLTDAIKENVNDVGNFKKYAYSNYTRLIYKKILGTQVNKYKKKHNIPAEENIRDYFDIETLTKIQSIESEIATIIQFNETLNDKELYDKIKKYVEEKAGKNI